MGWNPEADQSGFQPDGWQPPAPGAPYPSIYASRRISLPSGGIWIIDPEAGQYCEVDWSGALPTDVTLESVTYSLPADLTNQGEAIETGDGKSALLVGGAEHGVSYAIHIVATLSDASTIAFTAPLRCFNG